MFECRVSDRLYDSEHGRVSPGSAFWHSINLHSDATTQMDQSIHDRPTCPFSADDGAYSGHWKSTVARHWRPRRWLRDEVQPGCAACSVAWRRLDTQCTTITIDHDAIICFMTDRLTRVAAGRPSRRVET